MSIDNKNIIEKPLWYHDQNEYKASYGLLIACKNEDFRNLSYLWENYGTFFWSISEFKCIMEQAISQ